jgi:3D (Asp-Asp-Asp) domain-containing protein
MAPYTRRSVAWLPEYYSWKRRLSLSRKATASGTEAHEGTVAADPAVLPLGTRIRITGTTGYDGNYLVTDTGSAVKGRHIDLYLPSEAEAKQFGTQRVRVEIRQIGKGKADARKKDTASPPGRNN